MYLPLGISVSFVAVSELFCGELLETWDFRSFLSNFIANQITIYFG